jgi:hypothetical protein
MVFLLVSRCREARKLPDIRVRFWRQPNVEACAQATRACVWQAQRKIEPIGRR